MLSALQYERVRCSDFICTQVCPIIEEVTCVIGHHLSPKFQCNVLVAYIFMVPCLVENINQAYKSTNNVLYIRCQCSFC
jgi:hypothetical protein